MSLTPSSATDTHNGAYRGRRLVDGAVFEAVPFRQAIADGCTHIVVLCTRPPFKCGHCCRRKAHYTCLSSSSKASMALYLSFSRCCSCRGLQSMSRSDGCFSTSSRCSHSEADYTMPQGRAAAEGDQRRGGGGYKAWAPEPQLHARGVARRNAHAGRREAEPRRDAGGFFGLRTDLLQVVHVLAPRAAEPLKRQMRL